MAKSLRNLSLIAILLFAIFSTQTAYAQLTGTKNIPGDYASLDIAITDLNFAGVGAGGVVLNVVAANPQSAPAGGYEITATGTVANPITITGNANTITASNALVVGNLNDAIFRLSGSDYVTIQGFTMLENAANLVTAAATNNMTEWGVALLYASATDGCQNVTIQNNTITLNRTYQNTFGIYSNSTHTLAAVTVTASATGATGGNNNLKIYGNAINNVNQGIVIVGPTAIADVNTGIDVGGSLLSQGNVITNYGTTGTFSAYANVSTTVNGILIRNSNGFNCSYNTVTSSVGGVTAGTLNGIQVQASSSVPTATFTNNITFNSISLKSGLAAGAMTGIAVPTGSASTTSILNINNNDFNNWGHTVAASGTIIFIQVAAINLTTSISNNTFTNITVNTTGGVTFISQTFTLTAVGGSKTVSGNSIVTAFSKTGAGGTVLLVTDNGSSTTVVQSNCQNNNFSNITVTGATTLTGLNYTDGGTAPSRTVSGNTLNNWTGGTSTINCMNFTYWSGSTSTLNTNTVTNITGQGAVTGITIGTTVATANPMSITNNTINNLSSTGTGGAVTGITCSNNSTVINISGNVINTLSSTGASLVSGITVSNGVATSVLRNKVYDLSGSNASSTVSGITVSGGTTITVYNNLVGDLRAPNANAANPVNGINITGSTTANVFNNSVYIAATSIGALFGTSAVSVSTTPTVTLRNNIFVNGSTPSGAGLTVAYRRSTTTLTSYGASSNNNNFVASTIFTDGTNTDVLIGAYKTRVAARDAASFSENPNFRSTAGSNANYLKIDSTISSQMESGGATISTPAITSDYYNIARYPNVGYPENGSFPATAPDVGANEFGGIPIDMVPPNIAYTALSNTSGFGDRILSSTITDGSGVPIAGPLQPRIYYRKNADAYFSSQGSLQSGTGQNGVWNFTIVAADMGGVVATDVISYFVIAQDIVGPYITANPGAGLVATDVNTVTTPPTTPTTYIITSPPLSGDYTVGLALFRAATGLNIQMEARTRMVTREVEASAGGNSALRENPKNPSANSAEYLGSDSKTFVTQEVEEVYYAPTVNGMDYKGALYHELTKEEKRSLNLSDNMLGIYATVAAAVADANLRGLSGATQFLLTDASYSETYPLTIGSLVGASSTNKLTIKPQVGNTNCTITGTTTSAGIVLDGADYIVIDGSNNGTTSRDLTIINTNAGTASAVVWMQTTASLDAATNNTVKNCVITGNSNTTTLFGVGVGSNVIGITVGLSNNNNTISNNNVSKVQRGIFIQGTSTSRDLGTVISNNLLNAAAPNNIAFSGILISNQDGCSITGNTIDNIIQTAGTIDVFGITCGTIAVSTATFTGTSNPNTTITGNIIGAVQHTATYAACGIFYAGAGTGTTNIINNSIYGVGGNPTSGDFTSGILVSNVTGSTTNIYYNSISLTGTFTGGSDKIFGIAVGSGDFPVNVKNNIVLNTQVNGTGVSYGIVAGYATFANLASDYNNISGATNFGGTASMVTPTAQITLANWRTATGKEASSISGNPGFTSLTDLAIDPTSPNAWNVNGLGTQIASVTTDILGAARSTTVAGGATDLGAYNVTPLSTPPSATESAAPANSTTTTYTFNGRTIGSLTWGAGGTVPTSMDVTFYPGTNPPGAGAYPVGNGYWVFTPTGGSGYTYDIVINYDDAQLGTINPETDLRLAKSDNGGTLYTPYLDGGTGAGQYELNTTLNTIKVYGLTSFSTFAVTDNDLPLPVELASFTSSIDRRSVTLNWSTASELNNSGFDIERKSIGSENSWSKVGSVAGAGSSTTIKNYNFTENNLNTGKYNYRLKQIDFNGNFKYYDLSGEVIIGVPSKFEISQNYPNPFNPSTKINFDLPFDSKVQIKVFDMTGREITQILNETRAAGYYTAQFNASALSSGIYFYQINATGGNQSFVKTMKMVLVK